MENKIFECGLLLDPHSERNNFNFKELRKSLLKADCSTIYPIKYKKDNVKIYTQIGYLCVAYSIANARRNAEYLQTGILDEFSYDYIYANRDDEDWQNEGMFAGQALDQTLKYGVPKLLDFQTGLTTYPEIKKEFDKVKDKLYEKAKPYRISAYYEIIYENCDQFMDDIKFALTNNIELIIAVEIYNSFENAWWNNKGYIPNVDKTTDILQGGHQMYIIGYDEYDRLIVANSWGENGGDNGICYIPFSSNIIKNVYAIIDNVIEAKAKSLQYRLIWKDEVFETLDIANLYCDILKVDNSRVFNPYYYKNTYFISTVPYDNKENADKQKEILKDKGIRTVILPVDSEYIILYIKYPISKENVETLVSNNVFGNIEHINLEKDNKNYIGVKISEKDIINFKNECLKKFNISINFWESW